MPIYWSDKPSGPRRRGDQRAPSSLSWERILAAGVVLAVIIAVSARLALVALVDAPVAFGSVTLIPRPTNTATPVPPAGAGGRADARTVGTAIPMPTAQPRTFRLAVEQDLYATFSSPLEALDRAHEDVIVLPYAPGTTPEDLLTQRLADGVVFWTIEALPYGMPLAEIPYVLVVHPSIDRPGFSLPQLVAVAEGLDETYTLVVPTDDRLIRAFLDLDYLGYLVARVDSWDDVVGYVGSHDDAIGIVPWDSVDYRVRPVLIDGRGADPADTAGYPFCRRIWLMESSAMLMPAASLEDLRRDLAYEPGQTVVLVAVGDVMLGSHCGDLIAEAGPSYPFEGRDVWKLLSGADIALGNLASPLSERGELADGLAGYRAHPGSVEGLVYAGFDALSLANEQVTAFGSAALSDTLTSLRDAQIAPVGAGANREEAYRGVVLEREGLRVAIVGLNLGESEALAAGPEFPGVAWLDETWALRAVREACEQADVVVVSCHWGEPFVSEVSPEQIAAAEALLDAGADLIVGHGAHVVQALSYQEDGIVAYGLGDFVYHPWSDPNTSLGLALRCTLGAQGVKAVELVPLRVSDCQPYVLEGEDAAAAISLVTELAISHESAATPTPG
ncbi:MAG: CapA family protein [Anaerolineae bacterium]